MTQAQHTSNHPFRSIGQVFAGGGGAVHVIFDTEDEDDELGDGVGVGVMVGFDEVDGVGVGVAVGLVDEDELGGGEGDGHALLQPSAQSQTCWQPSWPISFWV